MNSITTILQMKRWLFTGLLFLSFAITNAQDPSSWTLLHDENGLKFYYQQLECSGHNLVHLKVENTTGSDINALYVVKINDGQYDLEFPQFLVDLKAGTTATSTCEEPDPQYTIPLGPQMSVVSISLSVNL